MSTIQFDKSNLKIKTSKSSGNFKKIPKPKSIDTDSNQQIQQLKNYILRCGVRKVWKKELEGSSVSQSISKLKKILQDLGMKGRPSLAKCKVIRDRLELEKEMKGIDTRNILPVGLKRFRDVETSPKKQKEVINISQ